MRPGFATGMSPDRESFFVLMAKGEMNKQDIDYHGKVNNLFLMYNNHKGVGGGQGVWHIWEIQLKRLALQYDYTCFADGYSICIRNIQNRLLYTW